MPSSKGKPTDPKLKEKVTEEVKAKPNKDGSGKGKMAAWKAAKIGKEYEAQGGDYENEAGSKNKPEKGAPVKKSEDTKKAETKTAEKDDEDEDKAEENDDEEEEEEKPKPKKETKTKANTGAKKDKVAKPKKEPRKGERTSARQAGKDAPETGEKRKSSGGDGKEGVKKAKK